MTFGPRRRYGGKLLWLVVEGRCGDFEVEGGGHHVWLVTAGVLHVAVSVGGERKETKLATAEYSEKIIFAVLCTRGKPTADCGESDVIPVMFTGINNCNDMFGRNLEL